MRKSKCSMCACCASRWNESRQAKAWSQIWSAHMKLGEFICAFIRAFICARVHSMSKHFWKHAVVEFSQHTQCICWIGCFKPSDDIICRRRTFRNIRRKDKAARTMISSWRSGVPHKPSSISCRRLKSGCGITSLLDTADWNRLVVESLRQLPWELLARHVCTV